MLIPPSSAAPALTDFFSKLRTASDRSASELSGFFRAFETSYESARAMRAATTPHFDLLRVFGLEYAELRHSDVLAWFLDPHSEHEQGGLFADALLTFFGHASGAGTDYTVLREKHGRTDVSLYAAERFAVFIENKVRHFERGLQVADMVTSMARVSSRQSIPVAHRYALFLTESGGESVSGPPADSAEFILQNLKPISRVDLFQIFHAALLQSPSFSPLLINFLECYLAAIRRVRHHLS